MCGIALKIPMQRSRVSRRDKWVGAARKVIHSNVLVTGAGQGIDGVDKKLNLFFFSRQMLFEATLLVFDRGHVRIAEHGDAIRIDLDKAIQSLLEGGPC